MKSTQTTITTGYQAAVAALHTAETVLKDARESGDQGATWNAERDLLKAEDAANDARLAVLDSAAKGAINDLVEAVGHRALLAHYVFTATGRFEGDLRAFLASLTGMLTDDEKRAAAAAALPAPALPHGSGLLTDDARFALRQAASRQAA